MLRPIDVEKRVTYPTGSAPEVCTSPAPGCCGYRKVGPAPKRNRLRRLYREAFRLTRQEMTTGLDLVLIPRTPQLPSLEELKRSLPRLVHQIARKLAKEAGSS